MNAGMLSGTGTVTSIAPPRSDQSYLSHAKASVRSAASTETPQSRASQQLCVPRWVCSLQGLHLIRQHSGQRGWRCKHRRQVLTWCGGLSCDELRRMIEATIAVNNMSQDCCINGLLLHLDQVYGALDSAAASATHRLYTGRAVASPACWSAVRFACVRVSTWVMWLPTKFVVGPVCGRSYPGSTLLARPSGS